MQKFIIDHICDEIDIDRLFECVKELQMFPKRNNPNLSSSSKYETYVCCFSKKRDSLPMWNYYLKGDNMRDLTLALTVGRVMKIIF